MTNNNQNNQSVENNVSDGAKEEIQDLEGRLKSLKQESRSGKENLYMIPMAVIVAGLLIASAVFYSGGNSSNSQTAAIGDRAPQEAPFQGDLDSVNPVAEDDHILGNPDAPVKIVEYSDFECPFCKRFHETMNQVMDEYGKDGQVAWVYRHFPLDQLHPIKARQEAIASECVSEIGGKDAFWLFANRLFELTPSNNQTDLDVVLPQIVQELGINQGQFQACLESGRYDNHIQEDVDNAIATGGSGTPWSVVVSESGQAFPLSGAQPYQSVKQLIDLALREQQ